MKNTVDKHPLAVNFKKLLKYNLNVFSIDEVLFFEWLIVKQKCFGDDFFYYQTKRIIDEIGIKRSRLETIRAKFLDYGLMIERRGALNMTHYYVNYDFISNLAGDMIRRIYLEEFLSEVRTLNFKDSKSISEEEREMTLALITRMDSVYNECRHVYNSLNHGSDLTLNANLDYNNKSLYQMNLLRLRYNVDTILETFGFYIDNLLDEKDYTPHALNNFSSYDSQLDGFPVFSHYCNKIFNDRSQMFLSS
ncbi:hypothetical protein J0X14_15305 [Muricauda sp. CAU 1633]|uniref:hypothetical protein n=1 Tax=Allomuricauda sp. CAU 1633 TaxID=2816036 RepID=UPI001A90551F|nr:hypothetical protein [Muricauda sp. CAU 1633]MBO0323676.1 hypothetical protein [Muricauda sp. CAU 1633]